MGLRVLVLLGASIAGRARSNFATVASADGSVYYSNELTGQFSLTLPAAVAAATSPAAGGPDGGGPGGTVGSGGRRPHPPPPPRPQPLRAPAAAVADEESATARPDLS